MAVEPCDQANSLLWLLVPVTMQKVVSSCWSLWPWQWSFLVAGPCDHGNRLLTYLPPLDIFLWWNFGLLSTFSCVIPAPAWRNCSYDQWRQYGAVLHEAVLYFSKIFHILQKATVSFAVLGSPLLPALRVVPNSADGRLWMGYCLQLLPLYLSIRPDTGDSCVPTPLPRHQGH